MPSAPPLLPLLLALAPTVAAGATEDPATTGFVDARVEAEEMVWSGGLLVGRGDVRVFAEGRFLQAKAFSWDPAARRLVLEAGHAETREGRFIFERAVLTEGAPPALEGLTWWAPGDRWVLECESMVLAPNGAHRATEVRASPCGCALDEAPWSLQAGRLQLDPERQRASFRSGSVAIGPLPPLPLPPASLPLKDRQGGLLLPRLAWTPEGLEAGLPVLFIPDETQDLVITPILRQGRGPRLQADGRRALSRGEDLAWLGVGGWDALAGEPRGAFDAVLGWTPGPWRLAADASLQSDAAYGRDYQEDFLSRQRAFHETRALVGLGAFRLHHDGFQGDGALPQRLFGAAWARAPRSLGPLASSSRISVERFGLGPSPWEARDTTERIEASQAFLLRSDLGPLRGDLTARGSGILAVPDENPRNMSSLGSAVLGLRESLPLWARHGDRLHLLDPGILADYRIATFEGGSDIPAPEMLPLWRLGPMLESRWMGPAAAPLHLVAELPWTSEGLQGAISAWASRGSLSFRASASAERIGSGTLVPAAMASLLHDDELFDLQLDLLHAAGEIEMDQAYAMAAVRLAPGGHTLRPGLATRADLRAGRLIEERVLLDVVHARHCLGFRLSASFAEDRTWPDLAFSMEAGPRVEAR